MAFLAGETLTAARLGRLQPKVYRAKCTSALSGAQTAVDVPGLSVTFTTEAAGATAVAVWSIDARSTGVNGGQMAVHALLDGSTASDTYATFRAQASPEQANVTSTMNFTIAAAGSHTIKCVTTQVANQQINIYSTLLVTIYEVA